ncbi:response regulator [Niabella sp. 22666]|uniref:response regulator n=1 Tax=Niabella sp. 22666 TaxID=3453954 RepID=UPI003F829853
MNNLMNEEAAIYNSVLVIDDHKMVTNGVKLIIGSLFQHFYVAHDGASAMHKVALHAPELIIIDFFLPDTHGDALVRQLKYKHPSTKILAYSFSYTPDTIIKMLKSGVDGYVIKKEDDDEFINAIHLLMQDRDYFCKEARLHIVNRFATSTDDYAIKHIIANIQFSGKELEMIRLLCKQMSSKEISNHLHLSERTVEQYRSNVMRKVKAKNLAGVIKFAIQNGVMMLEDL